MQIPHFILWITPEKSIFFSPHFCSVKVGKRRKVLLRFWIRQDESTVPNATGDAHTFCDRISPATHLSHWSHRFLHCTHQVTQTINEVLKKNHIHRRENTGVYTLTSITSQRRVTWDLQNQERGKSCKWQRFQCYICTKRHFSAAWICKIEHEQNW